MKYNNKKGLLDNVKSLFNERNLLSSKCYNNESEITEAEANAIESVIDEYYAFIGED